jgi:hypothetical protein
MHDDWVPKLRCVKCGGKQVGLILFARRTRSLAGRLCGLKRGGRCVPYGNRKAGRAFCCMSKIESNLKREIAWEIYDAMTALGADQELLAAIASWADGEGEEAVLDQLRSHNQKGSIYRKVICRSPES